MERNIIACYLRVSTEDQDERSQRREVRRYLDREGFATDRVRWLVDKSTGDNLERPAFDELDRLIENGAVATVIVWKVDRLARTMLDGLNTVSRWLKAGVRFISVTQQFDFRGPVGRMVAALLFGFAELEQQTRRDRQRAGIEAARERGVYRGRKPGATKAGVNPDRARELRAKGLTYHEIAEAMGVGHTTVRRYLGVVSR